jgi:hypothetical protein
MTTNACRHRWNPVAEPGSTSNGNVRNDPLRDVDPKEEIK